MAEIEREVVWCHSTAVTIPTGVFDDHDGPRTLVRFVGPILDAWKDALAARGITIEFWAPPFGACVTLPPDLKPSALRQFDFLAGAVGYLQEHCRRDLPEPSASSATAVITGDLVDIVTFGSDATPKVVEALRALGIAVLDTSSSKIRVRYTGDLAVLRDLHGVKIADKARDTVLLSHGLAVAVAAAGPNSDWLPGLDGSGELIAVADTGLDLGADGPTMHRDFQGRIAGIESWPINSSWSDVVVQAGLDDGPADKNSGHGTHVAGLALGDGTASAGDHRGVAPAAKLIFQAIEQYCEIKPESQSTVQSGYYLAGRPLDLRQLFGSARDKGARIHVNSWGDAAAGAYTNDCYESDLFLHGNPDALVLFAAGNDGADRDGDGRIDPGSLYAPGSAKNVLTIGATEGPLLGAGLRETWGDMDPSQERYTTIVDRALSVSGEADRIAMFSSAGPTADGRVKPDVCAPGTNLAAPRSQACNALAWGLADPMPYYMYDGGTSTATGVAGGLAALVRQAWRARGAAPTGVAIKALLILGCRPVRGRARYDAALPRESGYGRISVGASLPVQPGTTVQVFGDADPGLKTGDSRDFPIELAARSNVRAVLCWYDAPGDRLVNDLDLTLLAPDGSVAAGAPPDRTNTVEVLDVHDLPTGTHTLRVSGYNVPASPQTFALAVTITANS